MSTPADDAGDVAALRAEVEQLRTRRGDCICDYNPSTTDGPSEDCPQHGRPYSYWVERSDAKETALIEARAEVDSLRAENDGLRTVIAVRYERMERLMAMNDSLRVTLASVGEGIEKLLADARRNNGGASLHETWLYAPSVKALIPADPVSLADVRAGAEVSPEVLAADKNGDGCPLCDAMEDVTCAYHQGYEDGAEWGKTVPVSLADVRDKPPEPGYHRDGHGRSWACPACMGVMEPHEMSLPMRSLHDDDPEAVSDHG